MSYWYKKEQNSYIKYELKNNYLYLNDQIMYFVNTLPKGNILIVLNEKFVKYIDEEKQESLLIMEQIKDKKFYFVEDIWTNEPDREYSCEPSDSLDIYASWAHYNKKYYDEAYYHKSPYQKAHNIKMVNTKTFMWNDWPIDNLVEYDDATGLLTTDCYYLIEEFALDKIINEKIKYLSSKEYNIGKCTLKNPIKMSIGPGKMSIELTYDNGYILIVTYDVDDQNYFVDIRILHTSHCSKKIICMRATTFDLNNMVVLK